MLQHTISPGICNIPSRLPHLSLSGRLPAKAGYRPGHIAAISYIALALAPPAIAFLAYVAWHP